MSSIFACDLALNGNTLPRNFFLLFCFPFSSNFLEPALATNARFADSIGKTKAFFGKDTARTKTPFLHTLFLENERETSKLKWPGGGGVRFSMKWKATCKN